MSAQRLPDDFVPAAVTTRIEEQLRTMSQQLLSRPTLHAVIEEFHLYPDARATGVTENAIIEEMRDDARPRGGGGRRISGFLCCRRPRPCVAGNREIVAAHHRRAHQRGGPISPSTSMLFSIHQLAAVPRSTGRTGGAARPVPPQERRGITDSNAGESFGAGHRPGAAAVAGTIHQRRS